MKTGSQQILHHCVMKDRQNCMGVQGEVRVSQARHYYSPGRGGVEGRGTVSLGRSAWECKGKNGYLRHDTTIARGGGGVEGRGTVSLGRSQAEN